MDAPDTTTATITPLQGETVEPVRPRPYGSIVLGAILVIVGGLWLLDVLDVVDLGAAVVMSAILAVVGLALILGALDGPHSGLVVFGLLLTLAVVAVSVVPDDAFHGGVGERSFLVDDQAALAMNYDVGVGDLTLDMRGLTLTEAARVEVTVGAGEMRIWLPADVPVMIDASAGAGQIDLLGESADGLSVDRMYTSPGFEDAEVTLTLDLDVAAGQIEVTR